MNFKLVDISAYVFELVDVLCGFVVHRNKGVRLETKTLDLVEINRFLCT